MKTQEAPNLLDNAKQKIKRLEDSLEQAEARVNKMQTIIDGIINAYPQLEDLILAELEEVK